MKPANLYDAARVLGEHLGARLLYAHMVLAQLMDRHVPLEEFGLLVAEAEGKEVPYSASSVSRWEAGESEPSSAAILAICKLCRGRLDPGWLHYGDASKAPAPEVPNFTLADLARARASRGRKRRGAG